MGSGYSPRTDLGSAHVVKQFLFSIVPSILTLDFDLILGSFFTFWGPNGLFWDSKTIFGPNHVVEQLLSSSILTFLFGFGIIFYFFVP